METSYVEILGEASYTERVRHYPVSVDLEVMYPVTESEDIHARFASLDQRFTSAVAPFRSSFTSVEDGGTKFDLVSDGRTQRSRRLSRRYLFMAESPDAQDRLIAAVSCLAAGKAETVEVSVRQPFFECGKEEIDRAHRDAVADAQAKANVVARAARGQVGRVLSVRQLALRQRSSGAFGDSDWWGDLERFTPEFHIGGRGELDAGEPTRTIYVRFLVRFELLRDETGKAKTRRG